jgi:hypothetical protein
MSGFEMTPLAWYLLGVCVFVVALARYVVTHKE